MHLYFQIMPLRDPACVRDGGVDTLCKPPRTLVLYHAKFGNYAPNGVGASFKKLGT